MQEIRGKIVFVTGASAGLGRAIAIAFAREGSHVGMIARTEDGLRDAQNEIAGISSVKTAIAVADTADPEQLKQAVISLEAKLGVVDIWVNNAMETVFSEFQDITPEEFQRATEVSYLGFVYGTMEALKRMLPRDRGHVIQVGSALAYRSIPLQSAYCGAKAAIRGFTDSVRCEFIHNKRSLNITIVHMPALNTPQFSWARTHIARQPEPVGTIFQPEVGAEGVLHAAKYPRRAYWVGGSTIAAIIGNKISPGWMDKKMAAMCYTQQWLKGDVTPKRDGNLFHADDVGMHKTRGQFSAKAKTSSVSWKIVQWLTSW